MTNELRLTFARRGKGWRFTLHPNWSAQPSQPARFRSPLKEKDYEDLRWYLEEFMDFPGAGDHVRARDVEGRLEAWGLDLYEQLFGHGDRRDLLNDLLDSDPPQVLSVASQESEVLRLPWELLRDHRGPFTRRGITIRRQFEGGRRRLDYPAGLPLRILLVVSRPDDLGFIDPRSTTRGMLDALDTLAGDVQVDFCRPPTLPRLEQMLAEASRRGEPYHILHFDGHGTYMPTIGLGALCFEKETATGDCPTDLVPASRLGDLLAAENIPLAILEACRSGAVARQPVFRSVAPRLVESGVGSVVAMSHAVHVEATRILVERFYRELAAGSTVGSALEAGRAALMANPYRWLAHDPQASIPLQDWFLPNLYQRVEDAALVPPRPLAPLPSPDFGRGAGACPERSRRSEGEYPYDAFLSHSHANEEQVERFATTLRDRYGLRIFLDKWEIHRGPIHAVCEEGIRKSRCLLLACTADSLSSDWVAYEEAVARAIDPRGRQIIPLRLDEAELPPRLDALRWYDFRDPAQEPARLAELAAALGGELAVPGARRAPARGEDVGAFPPPPRYRFIGRARELHQLERALARHRAVLVSGMGGMGKTALSREAAFWWARSGLFPDGACFLSFERGADAEAAVQTLGTYLLGDDFQRLPEDRQRAEAARLFQEKQVLMVWDNFESTLPQFGAVQTEDPKGLQSRLRALFEEWTADENGRGRLLITARPEEAGLPRARRFALGGLARPDSLLLAARVFELHDIPRDDPRLARAKLEELLDLMGDHPLSIELVMPHFKNKALTVEQAMAQYADLLAAEQRQAGKKAAREGRPVERNESLLASLAFSTSRLSEAAQEALPWLAWFTAGVFEVNLLNLSQIEPETWDSIRVELEATALISVDNTLEIADRPYLRFHPTLPYAADAAGVPDVDEAQRRFVEVYRAVRQAVHRAFFGENPRAGMEVMAREEGNMRLAVQRALDLGDTRAAADLGDTMRNYLQRAGRLGERDRWAGWLAEQVSHVWSEQAAMAERQAAWALLSQGQPRPAIQRLEALIGRLETTTEFDPTFQLALANSYLGRIYNAVGLAEQAILVLKQAVRQWEALGQEQQDNLAACLGDLANALRNAGRLDDALEAAERALQVVKMQGRERDIASAEGMVARILAMQGRYAEADARYEQALQTARAAGDQELEGSLLQHQGGLAGDRGDLDRAAKLYKEAHKRFQAMNNEGAIMRTCNLLGVVEQHAGRLAAARGWYEKARELARRRGDTQMLGAVAQNLGVVAQQEGEAARQAGDEALARQRFQEAEQSIQESLAAWRQSGNQPNEAASLSQLGWLYLLLSEGSAEPAEALARAEEHAHRAREIREELRLPDVWKDYETLEDIARARGDAAGAAEWQRKKEAVQEERRRRAGGGLPQAFVQAVGMLCLAVGQAALAGEELPPQVEESLAALEEAPAPWGQVGRFLQAVAAHRRPLPPVPSGLPEELAQLLEALKHELH